MPAGKIQQKTSMLQGTLITFVILSLIATIASAILYIQSDKNKTKAATLQLQMDELFSSSEFNKRGDIIGSRTGKETYLGKMADYIDEMTLLTTGQLPEDLSAKDKLAYVKTKIISLLNTLQKFEIGITNETAGLTRVIEKLTVKLENIINTEQATQQKYSDLQDRFDDAMRVTQEKEETLLAEKEKYARQVEDITTDYHELKVLINQTADQQVKRFMDQLDKSRAENKDTKKELFKTQAQLKLAQDRIKKVQDKLASLVPPPDREVMAFQADGEIILIDDQAKIVHLNIGLKDRVYKGLTFSVYEKNVPIPRDGKGKAEIEVFNVDNNISAARILRSEIKRPIVLGDIIANLIWDSHGDNVFVIAGDFDLNGDAKIDRDANDKLQALVKKWGGKVSDEVSVNTDFVVLGSTPRVRRKPTFEAMEIDPMAMDKYNKSLEKLAHYKEVRKQARDLSIPVFNVQRFLDFIGYRTQSTRPGAF